MSGLNAPRLFALLVACVLGLRLLVLVLSPLELHFDEAQYWAWSRTLDWGYFSKPPLIAWAIAATTAIVGNAEWGVRLAAPLAHAAGAYFVFALTRRTYGDAAGVWAGFLWLTLPALWLSSFVISTDALVLPLWAAALYFLWRLSESGAWIWAILLGLCIGLGALAKYAMFYFFLCAALAALLAPTMRKALVSPQGAVACVIALAVFAPNLAWNAANSFETVAHTASNANLSANFFHPDAFLEFAGAQVGIIGPVLFFALARLLISAARRFRQLSEKERILIAFTLPPLAIIAVQALVSRAHANWAATAYPAAIVLVVGWLATSRGGRMLWAAAVTHVLVGVFALSILIAPSLADQLGFGNALKRMRGWSAVAEDVAARVNADNYTAVLTDHRAGYFELTYYWRDRTDLPPLRAWRLHAAPENAADAVAPMRAGEEGARVLVVHMYPFYEQFIGADFQTLSPLGASPLAIGTTDRSLSYSRGEGFAPVPRDEAFEARYRRLSAEE